jgi:hypothetical protein
MTVYDIDSNTPANEIELGVETLEEVIAPAIDPNHNETYVADLEVEELEEMIAPAVNPNHNETLASAD